MSPPTSPAHPPALVRARAAVCLTFLANGLGASNLVPRYPEIVENLGITKEVFGRAVMASSLGALLAGLTASWFITRFTSARVAAIGMIVLGAGLAAAGRAGHWLLLALCLAWVGGADAVVDVAQNAHGLRVERRWGSSIITSFHAAWSLGAVLGAAMGQAMAGAGVLLGVHMLLVLLLLSAVSGAAAPWMIKGPDADDRPDPVPAAPGPGDGPGPGSARTGAPGRWLTVLVVVVLSLMCAAAFVPEDIAFSWSALLLRSQGAGPAAAGAGVIALQGVMIVGRLAGDAVIDRLGPRAVIATGGLLVAGGMGFALASSSVPGTLAGLVLAGAGCAVAVPVAYAAADDVPGLRPGLGLTIVSWLARVIMLLCPPLVGRLVDAHGTQMALVYGLVGGVVLAAGWPALARRRSSRRRT